MTQELFKNFLASVDAKVSTVKRNILLFIHQGLPILHPTFLYNTKVVYFPPNGASELQPLDLGADTLHEV
jgi:hypothetical protein